MGENDDRKEKVMVDGNLRWQRGKSNGKRKNNGRNKVCNGRREKVTTQGREGGSDGRGEKVMIEGKEPWRKRKQW
jgi:hypothetical protein